MDRLAVCQGTGNPVPATALRKVPMRFLLPLLSLVMLTSISMPTWAEDGDAAPAVATTTTAAPAVDPVAADAPAEEAPADTFAASLAGLGIELSADEAKAVADYDAKPDGYEWPTYKTDDGEGSIAADLISKINAAADGDSFFTGSNIWMMLCAALVFIMHLGFATLETGLCRSKNTVNILFKNVMIVCIGLLTYAIAGFNTMYPGDNWIIPDVLAWGSYFTVDLADPVAYLGAMSSAYNPAYTAFTDFLFQGMFAATAATIISGAVAERIKLLPFLIFVSIYVLVLYPIVGSWQWGAGWLADRGFTDFAGSTLVHSVGGWGALVAILILGPRKGKFGSDGRIKPMLPSNLPLATIGVFLLWLGWFGFNGGSVLSAQAGGVSYVLVTTCLAAAMGGFAAGMTSWIVGKKPDLSMALNGILAGLVGITASAHMSSMMLSIFIGLSSGVIVYFAVLFFDKMKIDDPVGALSVHLVCGIWGTLMVAPTNGAWGIQIIGILAYGAACVVFALITGLIIKAIFGGLRVSEDEEDEGLDIGEHGTPAYHITEASH
jgi:ammonium transporter, Amt family